jgi:hypothetical protein
VAIDFPTSPTAGQQYAFNGVTYVFTSQGVWATAGASAITVINGSPQGRLTLQTLTPVMTTTQSAKTTIYYTPYVGNRVPIYDGTNMVMTTFAELSAATTDTTKSPAAIGVSKVNDWFVWSDAGTLRIGHGPDWTSDTVRSAGTALVMVAGTLLNNASITNGPAASRGTYVGTTRSNASSQLNFIFGSNAASGGAALLGVWNMYNRRRVVTTVQDSVASFAIGANTIAVFNGSVNNNVLVVTGLAEDTVLARFNAIASPGTGANACAGVGVDSTTVASGIMTGTGSLTGHAYGEYSAPLFGAHTLTALAVHQGGSSTGSYYGTGLVTGFIAPGLVVDIWN